eukprot:g8761.t1
MAASSAINVPKLKLQANAINQQILATNRSIQSKESCRNEKKQLMSQRIGIRSQCSSQRSNNYNTQRSSDGYETKTIEELKFEKDALNRKLYQLMNTIQLAEAEMSSHKIQDIRKAPTREEASRAFFKNRFGTTSQQAYAFTSKMNDLQKALIPTTRNRRRRNDGTEHAEVAARTIAGQMNR